MNTLGRWNAALDSEGQDMNRREFLMAGATAAAGLALARNAGGDGGSAAEQRSMPHRPDTKPIKEVRVGFVGVGARGSGLCQILMGLEGVRVNAVCDLLPERVAAIQAIAETNKHPKLTGYSGGLHEYKKLCAREDLDLVVNATPWEWHAPIAVEAMKAGKHAAIEVPAAITVEECWQLVETAEKTRRHCIMLENVCYFRNVMAILNMVREGVFGDLVHCEGGYQHDLIAAGDLLFDRKGALTWRGEHFAKYNGNLYPTHPIGPIAQWLNINRGDRFDYLVSVSSKDAGLDLRYAERTGAKTSPAQPRFKNGDVNTTIIRTAGGVTVTLYFDTQLPRPADMIFRVQGTKGMYLGTIEQIYLEGRSPKVDTWEPFAPYLEKYDHPLWKQLADKARGHSHGGGDFLQFYRLIKALRAGAPLDMDVYDAAAWSVICPMTERSVANRGRTEDFPDFTRGAWKIRPKLAIN
jgi:predicted dehydrogenase